MSMSPPVVHGMGIGRVQLQDAVVIIDRLGVTADLGKAVGPIHSQPRARRNKYLLLTGMQVHSSYKGPFSVIFHHTCGCTTAPGHRIAPWQGYNP